VPGNHLLQRAVPLEVSLRQRRGRDVGDGFVFPEVRESGVGGVVGGVDLVDGPEVLGADLVDDVGTVGVGAFLAGLEEAAPPGLAALRRGGSTSLRLLLRFQLSRPREERGPVGLEASLR
jgi:hypothetical protein